MKGRLAKLEHDMDDVEAKRKDVLPEANKRLMVHIPAGPFTMGGRDEGQSAQRATGAHDLQSAYYIGKTPVTNQDYREFVQCTGRRSTGSAASSLPRRR